MENTLAEQLREIVNVKGKVAADMLRNPWSEKDRHHALGMLSILADIKEVIKKSS